MSDTVNKRKAPPSDENDGNKKPRAMTRKKSASSMDLMLDRLESHVMLKNVAPFLAPRDVLTVMSIEEYEAKFHLKSRFCKEDGHQFLIRPASDDEEAFDFSRTCREVIDVANAYERIVVNEYREDFILEDGRELICPCCHSCENCGSVYGIKERVKELKTWCSDCNMSWCCVAGSRVRDPPNPFHQYCQECQSVHCQRVKKDRKESWEQCRDCDNMCYLDCAKSNERGRSRSDVTECTYGESTGFMVGGQFKCSRCHDIRASRYSFDCAKCCKPFCGGCRYVRICVACQK